MSHHHHPNLVGIDFGSLNCVAATLNRAGEPTVIHNAEHAARTPTAIYFAPTGETLIGAPAVESGHTDPDRVIFDLRAELINPESTFEIDQAPFKGVDLADLFFQKIVNDVRSAVGEFGLTVIAVPAHFHGEARAAVRDAAMTAGFPVVQLINEPTAIALAYETSCTLEGPIVICQFENGLIDVCVVRKNDEFLFELQCAAGDHHVFDRPVEIQAAALEKVLKRAMKSAGVKPRDIKNVLFAGSGPVDPSFGNAVESMIGVEPQCDENPETVIARGAAIGAHIIEQRQARTGSAKAA